jgi:hypothetical protein
MVYVDIGNMEVDVWLMDLIGYFLFRNLLSSTHIPCRVSMHITEHRLMIKSKSCDLGWSIALTTMVTTEHMVWKSCV